MRFIPDLPGLGVLSLNVRKWGRVGSGKTHIMTMLTNWLKPKKPEPGLLELDPFFRDTVSHLPREARKQYCQNLIKRCELDVKAAVSTDGNVCPRLLMRAAREALDGMGDS